MDQSEHNGSTLSLRRNLNKTKTFFGYPPNTILVTLGLILLILTITPLVSLVLSTFANTNPITSITKEYGFQNWKNTFGGEHSVAYFWEPLGHSLLIAVFACVFSIVFGGGVAYLITRTNMRFKKFISAIFIFPYVMPQWTLALFWQNLFISTGCRGGHVGEMQALTGWVVPEWFCYGPFPIAFVLGLHYAPFAYILIGGILRNMDANLEEAATILNIPRWKIFTRVTVPILKPALLSTILLVFSSAISSYSVAVTLGNPVNYKVLATQMETLLNSKTSWQYGIGNVISLVMIAMGLIVLYMNQKSTGSRKSFTTVSGKSGQISKINLGKVGQWVVAVVLCILVVFFCIGPMVSFALESVLPNPGTGDFSGFTWKYWVSKNHDIGSAGYNGIFHNDEFWKSIKGSLLLSVACSLIAGTVGLLIGYAVARKRKSKLANGVNALAFLPYLLPSITLSAIYFVMASNMSSIGITFLYTAPMFLAIVLGSIKYIPFASRSATNAMLQLSAEIEESAVIQNVPWWKRMVRVIFPIQKASFLSGYLLPFISCMREYDLFVFIGGNQMLLTKEMFVWHADGVFGLENAANLLLVVVILLVNWLVNLITGASLDKGIGG